jgi:CheY-like chemotaxis protein
MSLVLIVEDDGDLRALYTELLEERGHQVVGAADGVAALELASRLQPALVLTDWHMPRMDGLELCKALRRNVLLRHTRIILHSSDDVPEPWLADLCLRKRGDPTAIELAVEAVLALPKVTRPCKPCSRLTCVPAPCA